MLRQKYLSIVLSVSVCLLLVTLINSNFYNLVFGLNNFIIPDGMECIISMGVYPLSGSIFAYLERKSKLGALQYFWGGAIASVLLFILFGITTYLLYPEGAGEALQQTYSGFELAFDDRKIFGLVGVLMGLSYGLFGFSILGGTFSLLLSLFFRKKKELEI